MIRADEIARLDPRILPELQRAELEASVYSFLADLWIHRITLERVGENLENLQVRAGALTPKLRDRAVALKPAILALARSLELGTGSPPPDFATRQRAWILARRPRSRWVYVGLGVGGLIRCEVCAGWTRWRDPEAKIVHPWCDPLEVLNSLEIPGGP